MPTSCFRITSSFTRFARSATSPSFVYVSDPAPDSSLCRAATPRLCPLWLLLPDCVHFELQLLLSDCVCFNCSSPIVSASTAAPQLCPLQLQLPDCVHFNCSSPIASASTTAPRLHSPAVPEDSSPCPMFFAELEIEVRRSHVTSLVPPHEHPTSVTHIQTNTVKILMY